MNAYIAMERRGGRIVGQETNAGDVSLPFAESPAIAAHMLMQRGVKRLRLLVPVADDASAEDIQAARIAAGREVKRLAGL